MRPISRSSSLSPMPVGCNKDCFACSSIPSRLVDLFLPVCINSPVTNTGEGVPHLLQTFAVKLGDNKAGAACEPVQNLTPGINNHAVAEGLATVDMIAALRGGNHIGEIFNRTGAHQDFPMRLTGHGGKRRRQGKNLRAVVEHAPE